MRQPHAITRADFEAIDRGCVAAGLEAEYFTADDIVHLWNQGKSVDAIVKTAIAHAARCQERRTETTAT